MSGDAALREVSADRVRDLVTQAVCDCLSRGTGPNANLIDRLRIYERTARQAGLERQTIQVIASGRRLLGDHREMPAS
jgi:hypothetical protein